MEAYQMAQAKRVFDETQAAFINRTANGTNRKGDRYAYSNADDIFDYQKEIDNIRARFESDYVPVSNQLAETGVITQEEFIKRQREYRKLKKGGN
ncbi:MAG: hypothetical protein MJ139_05360 [Limosilactobacillus sp.]|nr:hypothetical protein [Limosilactobacillus sp.]